MGFKIIRTVNQLQIFDRDRRTSQIRMLTKYTQCRTGKLTLPLRKTNIEELSSSNLIIKANTQPLTIIGAIRDYNSSRLNK
jgi:hypothetical protein